MYGDTMRLGTQWVLVPKTYCLPPLLHRFRSGGSLWRGGIKVHTR